MVWTKSKRPVRPVLEGGLDYSKVAFISPNSTVIDIMGGPWLMETFLIVVQNLFIDVSEGNVNVAGIKTILTPIINKGELNEREQVVITTISFYSKTDKTMIVTNDYGTHEIDLEEN